MLLELRINNFALIERAQIAPGPRLNVLTGETGAGKSIIAGALGLLVGQRAASEQVGRGGPRALVEGAFDVSRAPRARALAEELGVELEDGILIVSREVEASGRSKVRLGGRMATAQALRELGALLVDFHGQHEGQLLLQSEAHLALLDAFGDASHSALLERVSEAFRAWREARKRLDELSRSEQERAQRLDTLQFQVEEIDKAKIQPGEDEALAEERTRLQNAEKLRSSAAQCTALLFGDEEPGATSLARQSLKAARELESVDASVGEWVERLQSAILELEDAAESARDYASSLDADPRRLEEIESRLFRLGRLKRKYGANGDEILAYRAQIEAEIATLMLSDEQIGALRDEAKNRRAAFNQLADELSHARKALAQQFASAVETQIADLALEKARFEVAFHEGEAAAHGRDRVEFVFSANPGQPLRPLAKIASGGEISRVMLGLRSVLRAGGDTDDHGVPVVVFDEVDVGIGGLTAERVGEKMAAIAGEHQVFCITHLPQIARRADHHFRIVKASGEDFTSVDVTALEGSERVHELARMMGSESAANLEHARVLLEEVKPTKKARKKSSKSS